MQLTLFAPGHVFAYTCAKKPIDKYLLKNLTFPNYKFGGGQYAVYPVKLSRFAEKNKVRRKYQNFIGGTLTNWVGGLSNQ